MSNEPDWLEEAYKKIERMPKEALDIRQAAKDDLYFFARLVNPGYVYGEVHREIFRWMSDYTLYGIDEEDEGGSNKLIMLPRAHLKSHMVATWAAWIILRHPEVTILYVSATAELAITQLYAIKNILGGTTFMRYFPEYINPQEGNREKWSSMSIIIDHPKRKEEGIRDATCKVAGLTTNTTGWHADIVCADDLVVPENAYTEDGRDSVAKKSSQFTSIRNAGGFTMACGTRYHPVDIYHTWKNQYFDLYDESGFEKLDRLPVWNIKEYKVETDNIFIWPRTVRPSDGKSFGFDRRVLAKIEAEYVDRTQFFAQYYNDPNESSSNRISRDTFQYYDPRKLQKSGSVWLYNNKKLNVYAAVDFAFSLNSNADYTAVVVIGIDCDHQIYILDIDRFRANKTIIYFNHLKELHSKWQFKKLRAEVTVAQDVIVNDIKDYLKRDHLQISVEKHRPNKAEGSKEERIAATLEHRYENYDMWHFEGGWTSVLEDELIKARPENDDIKDALACACGIAVAPKRSMRNQVKDFMGVKVANSRFGGVSF